MSNEHVSFSLGYEFAQSSHTGITETFIINSIPPHLKNYYDNYPIAVNPTSKQKKHGPEIKGRGGKVKRW